MTDNQCQPGTGDDVRAVALAICKSRTCEGISCCQCPANMGRTNCNAKKGAYDDAARAAIAVLSSDVAVAPANPVAWQVLMPNGKWHLLPTDWTLDEGVSGYTYRALYASPVPSTSRVTGLVPDPNSASGYKLSSTNQGGGK